MQERRKKDGRSPYAHIFGRYIQRGRGQATAMSDKDDVGIYYTALRNKLHLQHLHFISWARIHEQCLNYAPYFRLETQGLTILRVSFQNCTSGYIKRKDKQILASKSYFFILKRSSELI